jgi:hypothetical protein
MVLLVLLCTVFLAWLAWAEVPEECVPTPTVFPPASVIVPGDYVYPLWGQDLVIPMHVGEATGTFTFRKFEMIVAWDTEPPAWWRDEEWPDQRYWWLTDETGSQGQYEAYCRFDCNNEQGPDDEEVAWVCRAECWTFDTTQATYRYHQQIQCGEWTTEAEGAVYLPREVRVRHASRRVVP